MKSSNPPSRHSTGYRKPPATCRFPKGRSGNPKGRPRGRHSEAPYEAVLGQLVTLRECGVERRVTAAEAFLLHMAKRGLEGDGAAARAAMTAIEEARARRSDQDDSGIEMIEVVAVAPGSVNTALQPLRMARMLDRYRDTAHMALEPWIVEAALVRLDRHLSITEQVIVLRATRTPAKVKWPDWWKAKA